MKRSNETQQRLPAEASGIPEPLSVARAINASRINLNLLASERDGILRELISLVIEPGEQGSADTLFRALKAREKLCPTCVNEGVAIPHARSAIVGLVDKPMLAYGRHKTGVDFGALDGDPVHHFFLLCAPTVTEHLRLLARLSRLVQGPKFRKALLGVERADQAIVLIANTEQSLL